MAEALSASGSFEASPWSSASYSAFRSSLPRPKRRKCEEYLRASLTQVLPLAETSSPAPRRREASAGSGRTGTETGSESEEPVPVFTQCSTPPNSRTDQGWKTRSEKSWSAPACLACASEPGLPFLAIERNAPDISFVHFEAAPIVCAGWKTKKRAIAM